jgi:hypothetical protein
LNASLAIFELIMVKLLRCIVHLLKGQQASTIKFIFSERTAGNISVYTFQLPKALSIRYPRGHPASAVPVIKFSGSLNKAKQHLILLEINQDQAIRNVIAASRCRRRGDDILHRAIVALYINKQYCEVNIDK